MLFYRFLCLLYSDSLTTAFDVSKSQVLSVHTLMHVGYSYMVDTWINYWQSWWVPQVLILLTANTAPIDQNAGAILWHICKFLLIPEHLLHGEVFAILLYLLIPNIPAKQAGLCYFGTLDITQHSSLHVGHVRTLTAIMWHVFWWGLQWQSRSLRNVSNVFHQFLGEADVPADWSAILHMSVLCLI